MEYRIRENHEELKGVISNTHGFLSTYLDGGFREKWCGYWSPPYKYLDYIGVKVNGKWLNLENLEETRYNGRKIIYRNKLSSLKIKQEFKTPEELPGLEARFTVENTTDEQKAVKLSVEPGIDIRHKRNDIGPRKYDIERTEDTLEVKAGERELSIHGADFEFERESYVKDHYPGEKQVCLIPGEIYAKIELDPGESITTDIVFETDGKIKEKLDIPENSLRNDKLGRGFNYALENLKNLLYEKNGFGVIAGHPWFQNYWARDSFWTALGMIDAGMFEEAEKILENFGKREVPSKINTDGTIESDYPRCDSLPLYAIAADKLARFSGRKDQRDSAKKLLNEEKPVEKIVNHEPEGTWMDTLKREKAVDIQSLWIEALGRYGFETEKLEEGLELFKNDIYMKDNLEDDFESINPAVPLMFGQIEEEKAEKYLEKVNGEFASRYGVRTRSVTSPSYNPSGYHTGSVWGLTTCWAAAANLRYGEKGRGLHSLEKMNLFLDRNQLGAFPELVNAETGKSLGCDEQAWSAGLYIHVIDSYLLGMTEEDGKLVIDPVEGLDAERKGKRFRDGEVDVKVINGEAEVINSPDIEVDTR